MARKALLIGSQTGGLTGVGNDVAAMSKALDPWGFTSVSCEAENASRAGILDAYERLIAETRPDDAVVVYYSGHGGYSRAPDGETGDHRTIQFIVPTDYDASTEDDFRGITAAELSVLLARLTQRSRNATVVLDCCHSAHMSRDRELTAKALSRAVSHHLIASHVDNLRRGGLRLDLWTPPGNPNAVRIVACAPEQSAYEYENGEGVRTGMLTDALTEALAEVRAGAAGVPWSMIIDHVRQQVLTQMPSQRPDVEGPAQRVLFDLTETDPVAALPASQVAGRIRISGAALLGVRPGDDFVVMPGDLPGPDDVRKIGDVRVDRVDAGAAWGELRPPSPTVPLGARAHLVRTAAPALPVRLAGSAAYQTELARAIDTAPLVRQAEPDEDCPVRVEAGGDGLTVIDEIGPLHAPRPGDAAGIRQVLRDLTRLAQARALRCLSEDQEQALATAVTVEFGQVENGQPQPRSASGEVLYVDQPVYVRIRNDGSDPVYVSLLDVGVAAQISLLNPASAGGERLVPGQEYVFGRNDLTGACPGVTLSWPDGLDRGQPRPETIVVLATSAPVDARVLEQQGIRARTGPRSKLEHFFDQLNGSGLRDLVPTFGPTVRFAVQTIDFDLVPAPAPPAETATFQVDDRPDSAALLWSPKTVVPATVALRISDLVVHHNRAFRSADIRLDAVVITAGTHREPVYHTHTERFSNISDGQRLPLDNMLLYHGPATDYLDIALWVSRDSKGSQALSDLMRETLTATDIQAALLHVGGLLATAPQAAAAVSAVSAGATIVNAAYRLLRLTFGDSIGLYRTTLLAHEHFGVGRPVGQNTVRAQDFSFKYVVEDVTPPPARSGPSMEG